MCVWRLRIEKIADISGHVHHCGHYHEHYMYVVPTTCAL